MTALRAPTTQQAALAEAMRLRAIGAPRPRWWPCTAFHGDEVCTHPHREDEIRDEDEAGEAAAGRVAYVSSEARQTKEAGR